MLRALKMWKIFDKQSLNDEFYVLFENLSIDLTDTQLDDITEGIIDVYTGAFGTSSMAVDNNAIKVSISVYLPILDTLEMCVIISRVIDLLYKWLPIDVIREARDIVLGHNSIMIQSYEG